MEPKDKLLLSTIAVGLMSLSPAQIVRAWESPAYRRTLTKEQKEKIPVNPAGQLMMAGVAGDFASTTNNCSTDNCSGNNCSTDNCSGSNCSTNNCSGNNCSTDNCSGINCGMMG